MSNIDVVIPSYCVGKHVLGVINGILEYDFIRNIVVVDDACPEQTGQLVAGEYKNNSRVIILTHEKNQGVGGAVCTGYQFAFNNNADLVIKIDGDGQMDPKHIPTMIKPVVDGKVDYTKGNRFYFPRHLQKMPFIRILGNSALSLINKFCSGYWSIMDPTNGYTVLHRNAYNLLIPDNMAKDYFFESDMLYQLGNAHAVVRDIPLPAIYADEQSHLKVSRVLLKFPLRYLKRFLKRIILRYFIRDFNFASLEIIFGGLLFTSGTIFGLYKWIGNHIAQTDTPAGTVMIVGILMIVGFQLLLSALNYDVSHEPSVPLSYLQVEHDS